MRLHYKTAGGRWKVWHCEEMRVVRQCLWVDSDTNRWCQRVYPLVMSNGEFLEETHQAKVITIFTVQRLVLINPIPDDQFTQGIDIRRAMEEAMTPAVLTRSR